MPGRHQLLADITPLRESAAFRRLWAGTTLSAVGSTLTSFAVILQVYDLTRSPLAVGAIGMAQMVPTLLMGLLGGPVTDVLEATRQGFVGTVTWAETWPGLLALVGMLAVFGALALREMRRTGA